MHRVMVNLDLKREDGKFENLRPKDLYNMIGAILDGSKDSQLVTVYVELRKQKEFKKTDKGHYRIKSPKGA